MSKVLGLPCIGCSLHSYSTCWSWGACTGTCRLPSSLWPCPDLGQVHGPLLRLNQVSPADSGEYYCQVTSSSGTLEASVLVTIEASSPSPIPGEWQQQWVTLGHGRGESLPLPAPPCFSSRALALSSVNVLQPLPTTTGDQPESSPWHLVLPQGMETLLRSVALSPVSDSSHRTCRISGIHCHHL